MAFQLVGRYSGTSLRVKDDVLSIGHRKYKRDPEMAQPGPEVIGRGGDRDDRTQVMTDDNIM